MGMKCVEWQLDLFGVSPVITGKGTQIAKIGGKDGKVVQRYRFMMQKPDFKAALSLRSSGALYQVVNITILIPTLTNSHCLHL